MKNFFVICTSVLLILCAGIYISNKTSAFVDMNPNKAVETFTTVEEKTIFLDSGEGMEPFEIRGVDMGAGIPGHFATDYAISKNTYKRWFKMIQEMGANCVRVYTILDDTFYDAVYEYNKDREEPLYIIHGLWVNDYIHYSRVDAYDEKFLGELLKDSRTLVDVLHGNKEFSLGEDLGKGTYTSDISQWVIGYILGVEWEDTTVAFTDHMKKELDSYEGKYMYTTDEASPFEAMLAQVGDKLIDYETTKYKEQRLVAFTNWPTTDPLEWDDLVEFYFRKFEQVDVEHIKTTDAFLSGHFASYHIYPYFPDYFGFLDVLDIPSDEKQQFIDKHGTYNSYREYLTKINEHHTIPVVISEYGVPSSRGRAQSDRNTARAQGGMSEKEQAEALVTCYEDIMAAGCAGSVAFTWQDEWFKRTWNTMAYTDLNKTPYWSDYQTNEQYFGILSFDPGEGKSVCYVDGDVSEWTKDDVILQGDGYSLSNKYDEKYMYFYLHKDGFSDDPNQELYLPINTTPKTGSSKWNGADFLLKLSGKKNSELVVQKRYEALRAIYSQRVYGEDAYLNVPEKDTDEFVQIRLMLQVPIDPRKEIANTARETGDTFLTGGLTHGNGNPDSPDFNSLSDFYIQGDDIEIRIPWSLLNFSNPAEMYIHDDYYEHYGIENLAIEEMQVGLATLTDDEPSMEMGNIKLVGWKKNPTYHERLKEGYYALQKLWTQK
ncbi:hypothetical protein M2140_001244 [Clostridiales Family XIII bacterium PM5-7]